jgi:benzoate membrane transport protein
MREPITPAVVAGLTAFTWYAFGALPLQLSVTAQLGLPAGSVFIVWASGAVASIVLSARLAQPIPITWSIAGLVYLGSLAGRFPLPEIAGAMLVSAALLVLLALAGAGRHMMRWLPMPIVLGMFGGSLLEYMSRAVAATIEDAAVAGTVVAAYFASRLFASPRIPPVGVALAAGGIALALTGSIGTAPLDWRAPALEIPALAFDPVAIAAIGVPLIVLALGMGNAQGLGYVIAQGYAVPVDRVSRAVAAASLVNALFGGAPATVARNATAILAAPDAGPAPTRYVSVIVSSALALAMACAAMPLASLIAGLPKSFAAALMGVALVSAFQDALQKAFGGGAMRLGALVAFVVAATPFSAHGIPSALWALLAGMSASLAAERIELMRCWGLRTKLF